MKEHCRKTCGLCERITPPKSKCGNITVEYLQNGSFKCTQFLWEDTDDPSNDAKVCVAMELVCDDGGPGIDPCALVCLRNGTYGTWHYQVTSQKA